MSSAPELAVPPTLPCLVCGTELTAAMDGITHNQPAGATVFTATGNYGSTLFDPFGSCERLEVNVCDPCLAKAGAAGRVAHVHLERVAPIEHATRWDAAT